MSVVFGVKGRLGNALFRYLATSLFSIKYNLKYKIQDNINCIITDSTFIDWIEKDKQNILPNINRNLNYLFNGYYQHDIIYRKYKKDILDYINKNKDHYVLTDGINAGDGNYQKFYLKDIVNTPNNFNKYYNTVLHIRLEDRVHIFKYINNKKVMTTVTIEPIKKIINKINFTNNSCIVMKKPNSNFEKEFLSELIHYIKDKKNIDINIESNDILTDFHIMRNAETLVCSVSTLSWCAALLSDKIKKCWMPDYPSEINSNGHCKKPIENTEIYEF